MTNLTIFDQKGPQINEASNRLLEEIKNLKISNEDDVQVAINARENVRICIKRIEELKDEAVRPLNDQRKRILDQAKYYLEPLTDALDTVTGVLKDYLDAKARKAEEAARKAEEERLQKEQKLAAEAEKAKTPEAKKAIATKIEELAKTPKELIEAAPKTVRTSAGAVITRKLKWTFEIEDITVLAANRPDLILPNETAIRKLIASGERSLAGVRIYQSSELSA